jgi:glutathionyl-hydroquinone reductase
LNVPIFRMYFGSYVCLRSIRKQGLAPNQEGFEKHIAVLSGKLDVYDKILSKQKYLLGDVSFIPADTLTLLTRFISRKLVLLTFIIFP